MYPDGGKDKDTIFPTRTDDVVFKNPHRRVPRSAESDDDSVHEKLLAIGSYMQHHKFYGIDPRGLKVKPGNKEYDEPNWFLDAITSNPVSEIVFTGCNILRPKSTTLGN